jgi:hypothetical protein
LPSFGFHASTIRENANRKENVCGQIGNIGSRFGQGAGAKENTPTVSRIFSPFRAKV